MHLVLNFLVGLIWLINGVYAKIMNRVPRHRQIVARILGPAHAAPITMFIGVTETVMACWVVSGIACKWNAITQIVIIGAMNAVEFFLAPDLLLWKRWNAFFALILIVVIYGNAFFIKPGCAC